jgi:hypothetical protein
VCDLARSAAGGTDSERLRLAAAALNKAALIASDCGMPEYARTLCWRHWHAYLGARPLSGPVARFALEPFVNLARLLIRGGEGENAHELLCSLYHAVRSRTDAVIDGTPVSFRDLTSSEEDHRNLCRWLWTVLLADGTRALVVDGRWDRALAHVERRGGVGCRLLDGRQVAVVARCMAGDPASAVAVLDESVVTTGWERCVAACLLVLCLRSSERPVDGAISDMTARYFELQSARGLLVFYCRLGMAVIELAGGVGHPDGARAAGRLVDQVVEAGDGCAARDVLAHEQCRSRLVDVEASALDAAVQASGLGRGVMHAHLMSDIRQAVEASEAAVARAVAGPAALRASR